MRRALLVGSLTLGAAVLPVCLVLSGVPLFPAPVVAAPHVVAGGESAPTDPGPSGTDTIVVSLAASSTDPIGVATAAVQDAAAGLTAVQSAKLIGPDAVAVTLTGRLSDTAAQKLARAAARHAGVRAADRSLTFVPASSTVQDYQWNLLGGAGRYGVDAPGAWRTTQGKGVVVGVVDTGIAPNSALPGATRTVVTHVNGTAVVGTTAPNIAVTTTRTGSTTPLCSTTSDATGTFTCRFTSRPADSDRVTVTATDQFGRTSTQADVPVVDATPPAAPVVRPSNGTSVTGTAEAGATVTLTYTRNGNTVGTDATTVNTDGTWSLTPTTTLADGDIVTATATDPNGNVSESATIRIDAVPPEAPHLQPTNGASASGSREKGSRVTVTWTDHDGTAHETTIPADDTTTWTTALVPAAADGSTISATATDPAGNTSPPGTVTVDAVAPAPPVLRPSNGASVTGTAEAGATVTLTYTRDGNDIGTDTTTVNTDGTWSVTPTTTLADGDIVTATATDPSGNVSAVGSVTVDAVAPAPPVLTPSNGSSVAGTAEPGATIHLTYHHDGSDTAEAQSVAAGTDGTWSVVPSLTLTDGDTVTATASDTAGNTSRATSITVDTVAPEAPGLRHSNGVSVSGTKEAGSRVTVTWTDHDGTAHEATIPADDTTTWTTALVPAAADGSTISATATDPAGNTSPPGTVTVDAVAPANPVVAPSNGSRIAGTAEAGAAIAITYTRDGNTIGTDTATADGDGAWSLTPSAELADGDTVTVTATDASGNVSDPVTITVDTVAPRAPVLKPTAGSSVSGTKEAGSYVTVSWTDADGTDQRAVLGADDATTWSLVLTPEAADRSPIVATATDPAGNTSEAGTIRVDATAPDAPVVDPSNGHTVSGTAEANATVTISYRSWRGPRTTTTTAGSDGTWTRSLRPGAPNGSELSVTATDAAGNVSPATQLTVDATAPDAPAVNPTAGATASGTKESGSSVTVTWTGADGDHTSTVKADAATTWSIELDPEAVDGTTISATATDAAGNTSAPGTVTVTADSSEPGPTPPGDTPVAPAGSSGGPTISAAAKPASASSGASGTIGVTGTNLVGTVLPGRDFLDGDADPTDTDPGSHGTHVSGIIADTGLGGSPAGVAPAVQIEPLRALASGGGTMAAVIEAINWGAGLTGDNPYPVNVLNLSIQTRNATSCPAALQTAINGAVAKGVVVVAAAGNYNTSIASSAPANCKNVIVVTASTASGERAGYSSWGTAATTSDWLVAAPGGSGDSSLSCTLTACPSWILSQIGNNLVAKSGTSMAAPHVAGAAALLKAVNPALSPSQVAQVIRGTATPLRDGCPTAVCGSGVVNAALAVAKANNPGSVVPAIGVSGGVSLTVSGRAQVGAVLTAGPGSGATSYTRPASYQWLRNGVPIPGETASSYRVVGRDFMKAITVQATAAVGGATAVSGKVTVKIQGYLSPLTRPTAAGTSYKVKKTLKATPGTWSPETPKASYQWYRNGKKIKKATKATYKLTAADRGRSIKVKVTVSLTGYHSTSAYSASHKIKR